MIPPQTWHDGESSLTPPAAAGWGAKASSGFVSNFTVWLAAGGAAPAPWPFSAAGPSRPIARRSSSVRNSVASHRAT